MEDAGMDWVRERIGVERTRRTTLTTALVGIALAALGLTLRSSDAAI
jgi:hypothetical protein